MNYVIHILCISSTDNCLHGYFCTLEQVQNKQLHIDQMAYPFPGIPNAVGGAPASGRATIFKIHVQISVIYVG